MRKLSYQTSKLVLNEIMFEYFTFFNLKYLLFWILWIYDLSCSILYQPIYGLNPTTQLIFMNRFVGNALFFINCNQSGFYHSSWIYSNLAFYWLVQIEIFIASETLWSNSQICKGRKKYMNFNLNKWLLFFIFSTCCLSTFWLGHFLALILWLLSEMITSCFYEKWIPNFHEIFNQSVW